MRREQFEAWWEINYHNGNPPRFGWAAYREEGGYKIDDDASELDAMWNAWQAAIASMQSERDQLAAQLADVVAENASLKDAIQSHSESVHFCEVCGKDDPCSTDDVCYVLKETPATDRFIAEQRAQVWTEGSEPKEFGRYWVRYETDVGPQYCSARWMEYNFCASSDTNIHKIWLADHSRSINSLKGVTHYTKLPTVLEGVTQ